MNVYPSLIPFSIVFKLLREFILPWFVCVLEALIWCYVVPGGTLEACAEMMV